MSQAKREAGIFSTGDLARLTGASCRTVRYYEEVGLLRPLERESGGHRFFDASQLERLRFITDLRSLSFSLESIEELLSCAEGVASPSHAADRAIEILDGRIEDVQSKLRTLRRVRDTLVRTRLTLEECSQCTETWHSRECGDCDVRQGDRPPLVDMLWP